MYSINQFAYIVLNNRPEKILIKAKTADGYMVICNRNKFAVHESRVYPTLKSAYEHVLVANS